MGRNFVPLEGMEVSLWSSSANAPQLMHKSKFSVNEGRELVMDY